MKGIYYVAYGEQSRRCFKDVALPAVRKWLPDVPVAVASTSPVGGEDILIKLPDADIGGRLAKLSVFEATPKDWKYVLYMDADTEVKKDISFLFQIVEDGWDLAICRHWGKHDFRRFRNNDNLDEFDRSITEIGTDCSMAYQGGMFVFKRGVKVGRFFKMWLKEWKRWGKRDQAAFVRALNKVPLKIYLLPSCWNQRQNKQDTVIYHYQHIARRYAHDYFKKIDRLDSEDAWKGIR